MNPIARIESALRSALAELTARASAGERSADLLDLAQHARELAGLLDEALADLPDDGTIAYLRAAAREMGVMLAAIERELKGPQLQ